MRYIMQSTKTYLSLLALIASFGQFKPHNACKISGIYKHSTDLICPLNTEKYNVILSCTYKAILNLTITIGSTRRSTTLDTPTILFMRIDQNKFQWNVGLQSSTWQISRHQWQHNVLVLLLSAQNQVYRRFTCQWSKSAPKVWSANIIICKLMLEPMQCTHNITVPCSTRNIKK